MTSKADSFELTTVTLSNVEPKELEWLWENLIPLGKLTVIAGDPGSGKSLMLQDIAAAISTGRCLPVIKTQMSIGDSLIISAEDDLADTIRPRLEAAGADLTRIHAIQPVTDAEAKSSRQFALDKDIDRLDALVRKHPGTRLIGIDPISAYLGHTDSHKNAEVRGLLAPLAQLAQRHRIAVVAITHLNKSSLAAIYRAMGSIAFVAAARAVLAVVKDRGDPERRLVLPIKSNLASDQSGYAFRIGNTASGQPRLIWEEESVRVTVDDALAPDETRHSERREAAAWLEEELQNGPVATKDLQQRVKEAGLSWMTVRRAKDNLNIKPHKDGFQGPWMWGLPVKDDQDQRCCSGIAEEHVWDDASSFDVPWDGSAN